VVWAFGDNTMICEWDFCAVVHCIVLYGVCVLVFFLFSLLYCISNSAYVVNERHILVVSEIRKYHYLNV